MLVSVTTEQVDALATVVLRCAESLRGVERGVLEVRAEDLRSGSTSLDEAVHGLRGRWTPSLHGLAAHLYRLQAELGVVSTAYAGIEDLVVTSFANPWASSS